MYQPSHSLYSPSVILRNQRLKAWHDAILSRDIFFPQTKNGKARVPGNSTKSANTSYSTEGPWVVKHSHLRSVFTPPSQIYIHAFLLGIYTITLCIKVHTVHIRSLGQLLDCQAMHSPDLRNIHTIKEPLFEEKPRPAQFHRDYVAISCHAHQEKFGEWS